MHTSKTMYEKEKINNYHRTNGSCSSVHIDAYGVLSWTTARSGFHAPFVV